MAAVAVLLPQDAFHQSPALKPRRRFYDPVSPSTNTPAAVSGGRRSPNSKRRKGSPTKKDAAPVNPKPRSTPKSSAAVSPSNLVMGQVKILKRGEALPAPAPAREKVNPMAIDVLVSHKSLEKTPVKAPLVSHKSLEKTPLAKAPMVSHKPLAKSGKHLKFQYAFAGSAAATSPEPSAVPLPSFCGKRDGVVDPTRQLRKLLGLDLDLVL